MSVCDDLCQFTYSLHGLIPHQHSRDEPRGESALSALLDIEIADDGEDDRAEEIDQQIFHGVIDADIQIAANTEGLAAAVRVDDDDI